MAIKPEIINDIKISFITKGYSIYQLSKLHGVTTMTINKYRKKGNWNQDKLNYIADTEIKHKQALSIKQAELDLMDRHERAKKFKDIVNEDFKKLISGDLKIKSHETLLSATVDASKHIELLEGNLNEPGSNINIINYKLTFDKDGKPIVNDELKAKLENRTKSLI